MGVAEDIVTIIATKGLGKIGGNLFAGREPDKSGDPSITVYTRPSEPQAFTQDQVTPRVETPRVHIYVRSRSFGTAQALADELYTNLFINGIDANGTHYNWLQPMYKPMPDDVSEKDRYQIWFTLRAHNN